MDPGVRRDDGASVGGIGFGASAGRLTAARRRYPFPAKIQSFIHWNCP
jgi:hypothetical protein